MTSLDIGETAITYKIHIATLHNPDLFAKTVHDMAIKCASRGISPLTVAIVEDAVVESDSFDDNHSGVIALYFREVGSHYSPNASTSILDAERLLHVIKNEPPGIHLLCYPESYCAH